MSKFGNLKDRIQKDKNVDSVFVDIDYEVGEEKKPFTFSIEQILVLDISENEAGYTEQEVEYQLEQISYYRRIAREAYLEQMKYRKRLEREFKIWYAHCEEAAEKTIMREKGEEGAGFSKSSIATMLSAAKIESWILRNTELVKTHVKRREYIDSIFADEESLRDLADNIKERSMILLGILRRKREGDY